MYETLVLHTGGGAPSPRTRGTNRYRGAPAAGDTCTHSNSPSTPLTPNPWPCLPPPLWPLDRPVLPCPPRAATSAAAAAPLTAASVHGAGRSPGARRRSRRLRRGWQRRLRPALQSAPRELPPRVPSPRQDACLAPPPAPPRRSRNRPGARLAPWAAGRCPVSRTRPRHALPPTPLPLGPGGPEGLLSDSQAFFRSPAGASHPSPHQGDIQLCLCSISDRGLTIASTSPLYLQIAKTVRTYFSPR